MSDIEDRMLPNFNWAIEGLLAGMAHPGSSFSDPIDDLKELKAMGFSVLVTLTESPLPFDVVMRSGLAPVHIPIVDFKTPTIEQVEGFCGLVDRMRDQSKMVAVHCYAGLGRTGTMLAAYLIHREGLGAVQAMERLRRINAGYVQSETQEAFLHEWAENVKKSRGETERP
jgi:atypical dual specificity phosphatase